MAALAGLICVSILAHPLGAIPVEVGATVAAGKRSEDRFTRGMGKFRTSVAPNLLNSVQSDDFSEFHSAEAFVRLGIFEDETSYFGITIGRFVVPEQQLRETRSDLAFTRLGFTFDVPYFMFTYHYIGEMDFWRPMRRWQWEGGFGFGLVPTARWRGEGALISPNQYLPYNINQTANQGTIARLELGLRRYVTESIFLRMGLRATYTYLGQWTGTINGGDGEFWYLRDGSITPLSGVNAFVAPQTVFEPNLGLVQASLLKNPVELPAGVVEWQFSVGYHF
ncbi:MAG: hypothetical protein RIF32_23750 [Leptospirales bacterium]